MFTVTKLPYVFETSYWYLINIFVLFMKAICYKLLMNPEHNNDILQNYVFFVQYFPDKILKLEHEKTQTSD